MKKKTILAVFALVFSTLLPYLATKSTVSQPPSEATVGITLSEVTPQLWEDFNVTITVGGLINLQGFEILFNYDPGIVEYRGNDTKCCTLNAPPDLYKFPQADEGEVKVVLFPPGVQPRNGTNTLVTFKFYCSHVGSSGFYCNCTPYILYERGPVIQATYEYTVTEITRTIKVYENWTLPADINFPETGPVFDVDANDIVLDLNGHTINSSIEAGEAGCGIDAENKTHVTVENGTITNFQHGIQIIKCDQANITNMNILNSKDYAVKIEKSTNVRICNNNVSYNYHGCISLSSCSLSEVSHNILSNNELYGIDMRDSTNNTITNNTISNNKPGGIYIQNSNRNNIFNNNFINNTKDNKPNHASVSDSQTSSNSWNSSYPYGGNYWDDWNDTARLSIQSTRIVDEKSGKNHAIPGPDGIGDTAYVIDKNNRDECPLLNPCGSVLQVLDIRRVLVPPIGKNTTTTLPIAVFTNSSVADFNFNGMMGLISFSVSGQCTFCKVIVSRELLDSISEIKVDNIAAAHLLDWDEGYIFINFTCTVGTHEVEIRGGMARRCDINGDGKVNIADISRIAKEFGSTYSYQYP